MNLKKGYVTLTFPNHPKKFCPASLPTVVNQIRQMLPSAELHNGNGKRKVGSGLNMVGIKKGKWSGDPYHFNSTISPCFIS